MIALAIAFGSGLTVWPLLWALRFYIPSFPKGTTGVVKVGMAEIMKDISLVVKLPVGLDWRVKAAVFVLRVAAWGVKKLIAVEMTHAGE